MSYGNTTIIEDNAPPGVPEWFVTFADMMTLLLAFFIMLASMGNFEEPKQFESLLATLEEQFGHHPARGETEVNQVTPANADDVPDARHLAGTHSGGMIYFADLATELTDTNKQALAQIARQLASSDAAIEIRGHAARIAIDPQTGLRDWWDLADRRCHSTMAFLVEQGVDPGRIRLANAGVSEPVYQGNNAREFARNSRVEVRLMPVRTDQF